MPPDSPPRVLQLRSSCGLYGAEGVIANLARAYRGEMLTVCLEDRRDPHVELCTLLASEGFATGTVASRGAFDLPVIRRLAAIVRRFRPDLIHSHDYKSDALAWLAGRPMGVRLVSTLHGNLRHTAALRRYERIDAWFLRRFDAVAAVSGDRAEEARSYGVRPSRLAVITNGIDVDRFRPLPDRTSCRLGLGIPADGPLIGIVGRLSEEKGHALLLEALAGLPDARVAVVGDGELAEALNRKSMDLGVADRTHFLGRREDMPAVYNACDVLVLPSFSEGLPLTILEAAACEVPVVATPVGDIPRVVLDGKTGRLVPVGDAVALREALRGLLSGTEAAAMGRAAREHVVRHFSAGAMVEAYEDFYRGALGLMPARASLESAR